MSLYILYTYRETSSERDPPTITARNMFEMPRGDLPASMLSVSYCTGPGLVSRIGPMCFPTDMSAVQAAWACYSCLRRGCFVRFTLPSVWPMYRYALVNWISVRYLMGCGLLLG